MFVRFRTLFKVQRPLANQFLQKVEIEMEMNTPHSFDLIYPPDFNKFIVL